MPQGSLRSTPAWNLTRVHITFIQLGNQGRAYRSKSPHDPSSNYNSFCAKMLSFVTQTMNSSISASSAPESTSADDWPHGNHLNSFGHYQTTPMIASEHYSTDIPTSFLAEIQMGIPCQIHYALRRSALESQETMDYRPDDHLLLSIPLRRTARSNLHCSQLHDLSPPPPSTWPTVRSPTMAPLPRLPSTPQTISDYMPSMMTWQAFSIPFPKTVQRLDTKWQLTFDTPTITIDLHATGGPLQLSHIGQHHRRHPTQRTIDTNDITTIVALALDTCIFQACTTYFQQYKGRRLDPNSLLRFAMSPSLSLRALGINYITPSRTTPRSTSPTTGTWTTASSPSTTTFLLTLPSKL